MKYKVSIIIPVYNCISFLERAVESVVKQNDFEENEIILVDDGSTDGSADLCEKYCTQFKNIKVIHQKNAGVSVARNNGIDIAQGEWVFFLDSDDYLLADAFEKMFVHSDADIICASYETNIGSVSAYENRIKSGIHNKSDIQNELNYILASSNQFFYTCWAKLFKRSIIKSFDISFPAGRKYAEDMVFVYTYLTHCNLISLVKEKVYFYYVNPDNATSVIPKSFDTVYFIYNWKNMYFEKVVHTDKEIAHLITMSFLYSAVSSIKTAATYLKGKDSVKYISYILKNQDFDKLYNENIDNSSSGSTSDMLLDKFIRRKKPIMIYLLYKLLTFKSVIMKR